MTEEIKYINIKEFREKGYLQELNRRFLHPLGLALEIQQNEDGTEKLGGIWDYRNDPEGIRFDINNSELERRSAFIKKLNFIEMELFSRKIQREKALGYFIEPIYTPLEDDANPNS